MTDLHTVTKELLVHIDHEVEQRKHGGNAEQWAELEALSERAHAAVNAYIGPMIVNKGAISHEMLDQLSKAPAGIVMLDGETSNLIAKAREKRLMELAVTTCGLRDVLSRLMPFIDAADDVCTIFPEIALTDECREVVSDARVLLNNSALSIGTDILPLPPQLTPAIKDALNVPSVQIGAIATLFRATGSEIETNPESETAFVLFWFLRMAIIHGDKWRAEVGKELERMQRVYAAARKVGA